MHLPFHASNGITALQQHVLRTILYYDVFNYPLRAEEVFQFLGTNSVVQQDVARALEPGSSYDDYGPAYGYGVSEYSRYPGRTFDEVESELATGWYAGRGNSTLEWERAKGATRDAWQRVSDTIERAVPGDSDRDGK
jgi:hypothetical protein